jgi:glycerophosphoryl diester phosphodiesterase
MKKRFEVFFFYLFIFLLGNLSKPSLFALELIGHRGSECDAPENTWASFDEASRSKYDSIEIDLQVTKDGEFVIFHDKTLGRTSNGNGQLEDLPLSDLADLDVGSWFHSDFSDQRIPLLKDFLPEFKGKFSKNLYLDLKPSERWTEKKLSQLIILLNEHDLLERSYVCSFDFGLIQLASSLNRDLKIAFSIEKEEQYQKALQLPKGSTLLIDQKFGTSESLEELQDFELIFWTITTFEDFLRLKELGFERVITNLKPDVIEKNLIVQENIDSKKDENISPVEF